MSFPRTLNQILGPWGDPGFDSGLITRCREAWGKPIDTLSRMELATLIRQGIAVEELLPIARSRIQETDDDTEGFEGELELAMKNMN